MWQLHCKMKIVAAKLSSWSREAYGDLFRSVKEAEKKVNNLERKLVEDSNEEDRCALSKAKVGFTRLFKNQEEMLRQKERARWLKDGDKNTAYFHKVIKDRRRRLSIHNIQDKEGHRIQGHQNIATAAIHHFEELFKYHECIGDFRILPGTKKGFRRNEQNAHSQTFHLRSERSSEEYFEGAPLPSKIIAKILAKRVREILPLIISPNKSGFTQGRQIADNILLAQELVQDINKFNQHDNIVLKLDMAKAYDRVAWPYLCRIMRKLGFNETWIDLIYRHISNNWYSIILNGTRNGFFKSNRGLRQGDPLSPALFVISAELLSILLNSLSLNENYSGYYKPIKGPSQLINKNKSCVALAPKANIELIHKVVYITRMHKKEWPIKYLGCPLFVGRMKILFFSEMVQSITKRIHTWHSKFLSMGGKIVLIKHVLLVMPMHLLAAMKPPKGTFEQIEGAIADSFGMGMTT
ncbi:uncharacterized protein LOC132631241 [Lycium barbarum]|uniref:uncharacterized protein LOC132631241 n=1 Tax=Lycium barbarum TaxID=112863 RepID=UPI00293F5353|nr:uncharacterized protein LOC132631241 [Lycium barbarum]